ncbi:hypothetical protein Bbelb_186760 [Branchiostoma belcheri]|nr:hypothetical protein Bbelb_186760 [Branchiostoma belcheri]
MPMRLPQKGSTWRSRVYTVDEDKMDDEDSDEFSKEKRVYTVDEDKMDDENSDEFSKEKRVYTVDEDKMDDEDSDEFSKEKRVYTVDEDKMDDEDSDEFSQEDDSDDRPTGDADMYLSSFSSTPECHRPHTLVSSPSQHPEPDMAEEMEPNCSKQTFYNMWSEMHPDVFIKKDKLFQLVGAEIAVRNEETEKELPKTLTELLTTITPQEGVRRAAPGSSVSCASFYRPRACTRLSRGVFLLFSGTFRPVPITSTIEVKFIGEEETIDQEGPKNEMFRLALEAIFSTIRCWDIEIKKGDYIKYLDKRDHKGHILPPLLEMVQWCVYFKDQASLSDSDVGISRGKKGDDTKYLDKMDHKGHILPPLLGMEHHDIVPDVLHMMPSQYRRRELEENPSVRETTVRPESTGPKARRRAKKPGLQVQAQEKESQKVRKHTIDATAKLDNKSLQLKQKPLRKLQLSDFFRDRRDSRPATEGLHHPRVLRDGEEAGSPQLHRRDQYSEMSHLEIKMAMSWHISFLKDGNLDDHLLRQSRYFLCPEDATLKESSLEEHLNKQHLKYAVSLSNDLSFQMGSRQQHKIQAKHGNNTATILLSDKLAETASPHIWPAIGLFIVQEESIAAIREALQVLKDFNPNWHPSHFMVDFSTAEIAALEEEFQEKRYQDALEEVRTEMLAHKRTVPIRLEFEPDKCKDNNAIKIDAKLRDVWRIVGYIPVEKIPKLTKAMRKKEMSVHHKLNINDETELPCAVVSRRGHRC